MHLNDKVKAINVIETIKVNGLYLQEMRHYGERRKRLIQYLTIYDRRAEKQRRNAMKIDIEV